MKSSDRAQKATGRHTDLWISRLTPFPWWERYLDAADREEASRYATMKARRLFLLARAYLRRVLAVYMGGEPRELRFVRGRHGKPRLAGECSPRLYFNLSHSRETLLTAVSRSGPVGVDIEHMRPINAGWLARCWFSDREYIEWMHLKPGVRQSAFFHVWCRKEALIKALGLGLAMPLDSFSVSVEPDRAELLEFRGHVPRRWRISRIEAGEGCAAALATAGDPGTIAVKEIA